MVVHAIWVYVVYLVPTDISIDREHSQAVLQFALFGSANAMVQLYYNQRKRLFLNSILNKLRQNKF